MQFILITCPNNLLSTVKTSSVMNFGQLHEKGIFDLLSLLRSFNHTGYYSGKVVLFQSSLAFFILEIL